MVLLALVYVIGIAITSIYSQCIGNISQVEFSALEKLYNSTKVGQATTHSISKISFLLNQLL
jgi:hypothetical protein